MSLRRERDGFPVLGIVAFLVILGVVGATLLRNSDALGALLSLGILVGVVGMVVGLWLVYFDRHESE